MPYAGLIRVDVKALSDVSLKVAARMDIPQEYSQPTQRFRKMRADDTQMYMLQSYAVSAHRQQKFPLLPLLFLIKEKRRSLFMMK